jgi:pyruvate dehydrogenase E1 component
VTLGPEGGAHQSVITPSIGIEQPGCVAWEPAFGQDFEWAFLHALSRLGRLDGEAAYFRLSTRPLAQAAAGLPEKGEARESRRRDVLAGGYRLRGGRAPLTLVAVGALVPEALEAAEEVDAEVVVLTSPDLVFRALQARRGLTDGDDAILDRLFPEPRPLVTLLDGHPHTLAFLGGIHGAPVSCLGVTTFGQSGDIAELYAYHGIDAETVVGAALDLL